MFWKAFEAKKPVLLIDETDKADIEFPNDLLQELDSMEFLFMKLRNYVAEKTYNYYYF